MEKTANYLKNIRIEKEISLEKASKSLKISIETLRAIEEADSENLPNKSYLRGFIFSYGKFLKADIDKLDELFKEEFGTTNPELKLDEVQAETWKTVPIVSKIKINRTIITSISLIILICAALVFRNLLQKYKNEGQITQTEVTEVDKENAPSEKIETETSTEVATTNEKISDTKATKQTSAPTKTNFQTYKSKEKFNEVIVRAIKNSTFTFKTKKSPLQNISLKKGEFQIIKSKSLITLKEGSFKELELIFNGKLVTKETKINDSELKILFK